MPKYRVNGTVTVYVSCIVEADSEEEAIEQAEDELTALNSYAGNGGMDKLIGVRGSNHSVESSDLVEWESADLLDGEEDEG